MTPEQAAKTKARSYGMLGAGIAVLIVAYQYILPVTGVAEPPPEFAPYLFAGIGIVCFIVAAFLWRRATKEKVAALPAADLSGPQGKTVIGLMTLGVLALAGSYFVDHLVPNDEILGLLLSGGLLVVMIVCFLIAARIARKLPRKASTPGAAPQ
jgi:Na+/melibiose symporter-like transporter